MSFEVFMQVWCLQKSKLWWKQGKTGEKNQDSAIFAQHIPCANSLLCQFSKIHALSPFPKSQCEFHKNANLVRIRFCDKISNHALYLGELQECEIFAQHSHNTCTTYCVVRNSHNTPLVRNFELLHPYPPQSQAFEPCPQLLKVGPTHHFCKYLV